MSGVRWLKSAVEIEKLSSELIGRSRSRVTEWVTAGYQAGKEAVRC